MCGLVGVVGNIVEQDKKALNLLMRYDVSRGWDSTGLAVLNKQDEIMLYKHIGPPEYLYNSSEDFNAVGTYKKEGKLFIGHNRAATKGKVTNENAHPFLHDGIVGAHNGTLTSVSTLERGTDFEVDSEAIFYNLSLYEPKSVIANIYGAYALTWYDDGSDKLYIIRNSQRPLFYTRRKDGDAIFWASEEWMLEYALKAARISHDEIKPFDINTLYSLDVSTIGKSGYSGFRMTEFEMEGNVKGYTPPPPEPKKNTGSATNNPFVGGGSSSFFSKEDLQEMKKLVGKTIQFRFSCIKSGMGKSRYLQAYCEDFKIDYDVRIYAEGHKNWKEWLKNTHFHTYEGVVKRVNELWNRGKREVYLVIDLRTINYVKATTHTTSDKIEDKKDITEQLEDLFKNRDLGNNSNLDDRFYDGFAGVQLTHDEWLKATKKGCAGCSSEASEYDCDLVFISHDEFLCGINGCCETFAEHIPVNANYMN